MPTVIGWLPQIRSFHSFTGLDTVNKNFDFFCSYAHDDNDDRWVERFAEELEKTCRKLTGQKPRIFIDRESLMTSDIWEKKIHSALEGSRVLIAFISPSYIRSEWCQREWMLFALKEAQLRQEKLLASEQGLVFPLLLFPLDRGRFNEIEAEFSSAVKKRQWLDVSSQIVGAPIRPDQVRLLAERLIDSVDELEQRKRRSVSESANASSGMTICDPKLGLEWAATLSQDEMSFEAALTYVNALMIGEKRGWRLPTKSELEGIMDSGPLEINPEVSGFPLREPFNAQRYGYLHSGTLVEQPEGGNYVMNVRNGYIFNGKGLDCYVRAVRRLPAAYI